MLRGFVKVSGRDFAHHLLLSRMKDFTHIPQLPVKGSASK